MTKATLDQTLLTLHRAVKYLQLTRMASVHYIGAADITAIAILEDAAKRVLKGDAQ